MGEGTTEKSGDCKNNENTIRHGKMPIIMGLIVGIVVLFFVFLWWKNSVSKDQESIGDREIVDAGEAEEKSSALSQEDVPDEYLYGGILDQLIRYGFYEGTDAAEAYRLPGFYFTPYYTAIPEQREYSGYWLQDLSGDGIPELLLVPQLLEQGSPNAWGNIEAIYTWKDGKYYLLAGGQWRHYAVLEDGRLLETEMTVFRSHYSICEIGGEVPQLLHIETYDFEEAIDGDMYNHSEDCYYTDANGVKTLSEKSSIECLEDWRDIVDHQIQVVPWKTLEEYFKNYYGKSGADVPEVIDQVQDISEFFGRPR